MEKMIISNRQFAFILFIMRATIVLTFLPILTTGTAMQDAWVAAVMTFFFHSFGGVVYYSPGCTPCRGKYG